MLVGELGFLTAVALLFAWNWRPTLVVFVIPFVAVRFLMMANRHWSEMPGEFQDNLATYASEGANVFEGIDFFVVWLMLMLRRYSFLSRCYVNLDGRARSQEEIVALLRSRTALIARRA